VVNGKIATVGNDLNTASPKTAFLTQVIEAIQLNAMALGWMVSRLKTRSDSTEFLALPWTEIAEPEDIFLERLVDAAHEKIRQECYVNSVLTVRIKGNNMYAISISHTTETASQIPVFNKTPLRLVERS